MRIKFGACLLLFFAGLAARAEEPAVALQTTTEATTPHLSGDAPSLVTLSDPDYRNVLFGSAMFGASFDTAGFTETNGATSSNAMFFVQPSIAFRQTVPTANWTLSYTPGVSISQHATDTTLFTHNLAGDGVWKATPRLTLHARQDYSISTNPFETVGRVALLPDLGGYFGPNYDGVIPSSKRIAYVTNADISYRMTAHTSIGITGGYQQFDYSSTSNTLLSSSLVNSTVLNGSVFVSDQISRRQTLGVQLAYTDIYSYGPQESRVQAPAVLLFDTVRLTQHSLLTAFAGPEYSRSSTDVTSGVSILQNAWHPAAGVTYAWSGTQDALTLQFSRRISPGGGLMNANIMTFGSAAFRTKLSKRWTTEERLSVDNQDELVLSGQNVSFRTLWAGGSLTREFNRNFLIRLDSAYISQTGNGLGFVPGNHGLVQITVDIHFLKGLGR
jgi:hypothetical protein